MKQYIYILENLDCASCANKIEKELNRQDFIKDVLLSFTTLKLQFKCNEEDLERVLAIVDSIEEGINFIPFNQEVSKKKNDYHSLIKVIIAIIIYTSTLIFTNSIYQIIAYYLAYLVVSYSLIITLFKNIYHKRFFNEISLMVIATIGALIIQEYTEAIAVIIFYTVGETLHSISVNKSRLEISKMLSSNTKEVNIISGDKVIIKKESAISIGDLILIKPGEQLIVDGLIVEGECFFDTSYASGESQEKLLGVGDEVFAGYIAKNSGVIIKAEKLASESLIAKINQLVEVASQKKSKSESFITRFASVYTPIVFILAVIIATIPSIIFKDFNTYFYRSLMFLVVACPCALVISIPLSFFAGIGRLSQEGILIKGGQYLETISHCNSIVFDKTGTLTKGEFAIAKICALEVSEQELIKIAAHCQYYSSHPLAKVILKAYDKDIEVNSISNFKEISGKGVVINYHQELVITGNFTLMQDYGIDIENINDGTIIYVASGGNLLGYLILKDQIKDNLVNTIANFKRNNFKNLYILSGDNQASVQGVAKEIGINNYYYNLLPNQKLEILEQIIKNSKGGVAFVGDGINDSPSLKRADIGIAMGQRGTDIAIESADLIILSDDLNKINHGYKISKFTLKIVKQNIFLAIAIKLLVLSLGAIGMAKMWEAIIADVGVTILVIINSLRIIRYKIKRR